MKTRERVDFYAKTLLIIALLLTGLYFLKPLLAPLLFSILIALVVVPASNYLESKNINRVWSTTIVLSCLFIILLILSVLLSAQFNNLIQDFPELEASLNQKIKELFSFLEDKWQFTKKDGLSMIERNSSQLIASGGKYFSKAVSSTTEFISFISLMPIYTFLLLYYRERMEKGIRGLFFSKDNDKKNLLKEIQSTVQSYAFGLSIVVSVIAVLNTLGLWALDISYPIFLGIFSALLTVIPYVGVVIGGSIPVILALITKDSYWYTIGVIILYWLVQFLEGNFITPRIVGNQINLNAFTIIFGLVAAGQFWGISGLIIAVPILAILKLSLGKSKSLKPIAEMMGK